MNLSELSTPCYVVDEALVEKNLRILWGIMERTGAKILLAQKAFSMYDLYPLIGEYLCGATASGLYEARLCAEEMAAPLAARGRVCENHIFSPAYREKDFEEILRYCDHIVFNSWPQVEKFGGRAKAAGKSVGLRINPERSTQEGHAIYDPCAAGSRLGVTRAGFIRGMGGASNAAVGDAGTTDRKVWREGPLSFLDGLHFHTLCEQDSDALEATLEAVEERFGEYLRGMKWINFGGGHHITREGYDIPRLERCIRRMQEKYGLTVYLEPGEAVALNAGFLVTEVLEIQETDIRPESASEEEIPGTVSGKGASDTVGSPEAVSVKETLDTAGSPEVVSVKETSDTAGSPEVALVPETSVEERGTAAGNLRIAILDTSAACHMPDVLEMPYRPPLQKSGQPGEKRYTYRLGGPTCLTGDVIGDYSFDEPLREGERLIFEDMAIYSMVKNNTFNGMPLPAIVLRGKDGEYRTVRKFGYEDFKGRLGSASSFPVL